MNIYYTAKDIEELAEKGLQQLELGPNITLTDFARETAQQLGIDLVEGGGQVIPSTQPASPSSSAAIVDDKYNKPKGCQHTSNPLTAAQSQFTDPSAQSMENTDSNTVNRLVDLMGKVIKRGG